MGSLADDIHRNVGAIEIMADPLTIQAVALAGIQVATDRYLGGGIIDTWEREMRQHLARAHTAAFLVGLSERLNVPLDSPLLSEKRLSRAERNELKQYVQVQLSYFDGFVADVRAGGMSEAQIRARAALYSGATRGTYSVGRWGNIALPFHPTQGSECGANCKCAWEVVSLGEGDYDAYWHMGAVETVHCATCPSRAAASPYEIRGGVLV